VKKQLSILCVLYTIFVVYGSLVPLDYRPFPLEEAWSKFRNIRYLNLGIASRADWVANILLFIPLAYLWSGRLSLATQNKLLRGIGITMVLFACILLTVSIEFCQLFFPPRTVSLNDIIAETIGGLIGVFAWLFSGNNFLEWLKKFYLNKSDHLIYLKLYIGGLLFYSVIPLDLTLSPVEFFHKWQEGRIVLIPFTHLQSDVIQNVYQTVADILLWCPVPWLWSRNGNFTRSQLLIKTLIAATVIEFLQLFVYSRTTDTTDIVTALMGSGIGLQLVSHSGQALRNQIALIKPLLIGAFIAWSFIIAAVFWYPYHFDWTLGLTAWTASFFKLPFYSYYYGTEYRAITEVFHKTLFFFPLGALAGLYPLNKKSDKIPALILALIGLIAFMVEFGQAFLPQKSTDITDWLLEVLGGYAGYKIIVLLASAPTPVPTAQNARFTDTKLKNPTNHTRQISKNAPAPLGLFFSVLPFLATFITLALLKNSSRIPYNIRELFAGEYPLLNTLGFTVLIYWCFSFPMWHLLKLGDKSKNLGFFVIKTVSIHAVITWLLVRISLPMESIYDVIGNPVLSLPSELEMGLRFVFLFGIFSTMITAGTFFSIHSTVNPRRSLLPVILGAIESGICIGLAFWIVIVEAGTDNLIELLPNSGYSFKTINLLVYLFLFAWLGSSLATSISHRQYLRIGILGIMFAVSSPISYQLFSWGTEQFILKYGRLFSAAQFLLSSNREQLASGEELSARFYILHTALVFCTMLAQWSILTLYKSLSIRNPAIRSNAL